MLKRNMSIVLAALSFAFAGAMVVLSTNYGLPFDSPFEIYTLTTIAIVGGVALAVLIAEVVISDREPVTGSPNRRLPRR